MKIKFYVSLFFLVLTSFLWAAEQKAISWEEALELARQSNPELRSAYTSLQSAKFQVMQARSGFYPAISAKTGYVFDSSLSTAEKTYSANLIATENLFNGLLDSTKIQRAKSSEKVSDANLDSVKSKISFDLKNSFAGLIYSQKFIALTEDIIRRRESNLRLVQLRFESGRENVGSLNLSKAYLAQARYDHLQAINSLEVNKADLARVLGVEDYKDLVIQGEVPVSDPPPTKEREIDFKSILLSIPEYKKSKAQELVSKADVSLAQSNFFPTVNLIQTIGRTGGGVSTSNHSWSLEANITFPLFDGARDYYATKSALENYRSSVLDSKNLEKVSLTKLKDSFAKYIESIMKLEVDTAFVTAASSRERIAKAQYNNGLITFTDWDSIENDLITRQKVLLQSQRERITAEAAWEQSQGKGVIQ